MSAPNGPCRTSCASPERKTATGSTASCSGLLRPGTLRSDRAAARSAAQPEDNRFMSGFTGLSIESGSGGRSCDGKWQFIQTGSAFVGTHTWLQGIAERLSNHARNTKISTSFDIRARLCRRRSGPEGLSKRGVMTKKERLRRLQGISAEDLANQFYALSHPDRIRILYLYALCGTVPRDCLREALNITESDLQVHLDNLGKAGFLVWETQKSRKRRLKMLRTLLVYLIVDVFDQGTGLDEELAQSVLKIMRRKRFSWDEE